MNLKRLLNILVRISYVFTMQKEVGPDVQFCFWFDA